MKIRFLMIICCVLFLISGCSADSEHEEIGSSIDNKEENTVGSIEEQDDMEENKVRVIINEIEFTATLEENETAKKFVSMLPMTIQMNELNGNEKYAYLSFELRQNQDSNPETINEGDIMCYSSNCLVMFYESFSTNFKYVSIGHIDDTSKLKETLANGSSEVTFEVISE